MAKSSKAKSKKSKASKKKSSDKAAVRPLGGRILVRRLEPEEVTDGGIILPDAAKEKPQKGKVIALGDGRELADGSRADFQVKKGDTVLFKSYAGTDVKVEGEELMIMEEEDVLAIID